MWDMDFEHLIAITLLGLIPAFIAHKKGRNFFIWWLFGTLLFIIALPAALFIRPLRRRGTVNFLRVNVCRA